VTYNLLLLGLFSQTVAPQTPARLLEIVQSLLHPLDILQPQLCLDDFHVTEGVHITLNVNDFRVVKRTDNLEDSIDGTDVRQERVTETSSGRCALSVTTND
jgi:hypothetical protein